MPTDALRSTLTTLISSGTEDNAALNALLGAYTRFHVVLAVVAVVFLVAVAVFSGFCWRRFRRSRGRPFERRTYLGFGLLGVAVGLFLAVAAAANVSVVADPRPGFAGAVDMIGVPPPGSRLAGLQESFTGWLRSGRPEMPAPVARAVDDRLAWQRPKAIVCAVLLVLVVALGAVVWHALVRRSRAGVGSSAALLLTGVAAVPVALVFMLMVMGNTESALAPLALTLIYG